MGVSGGRKEEMNASSVLPHCLKQGLGKQEVQLRSLCPCDSVFHLLHLPHWIILKHASFIHIKKSTLT